ncbi:MAG: gliding motility-associated C-terminal domain-containing protein [Cyclobacteriaceae bacterium]|nr:gliding motility-associated C-terminal domain-containing protein [Cyclobacteriaceae bacterium]
MRIIKTLLFTLLSIWAQAQVINRAEYFIDTDPGPGNGISVAVSSPAVSVNFNFNIPTTSLSNGFHIMGFRTRSSITGYWSHAMYQAFYIIPPVATTPAINLVKAEYFFDSDPGNGNGINIPIAAAPAINTSLAVPISSLAPGFHTLHVRTKDNTTRWALVHAQSFYIVPPVVPAGPSNLTKAEYFFDADPGPGNGVALAVPAAANQNNSFAIPVTGLSAGFHKLIVRYKSNTSSAAWSHAYVASFYIIPTSELAAQNLVRMEYFIDTDPGFGLGQSISFTPASSINLPVAINLTGIPSGNHVLGVRAKDDKGYWSDIVTSLLTISNCTPPPAPVAPNQSRCDAGEVTLTATGATGAQQYRWYDDPVANTLVFTGAAFTTPSLTATRNYYVSIYDPATACESARVTVTATVTVIAKPAINPYGTISFCEGSFVFLSAPTGFATYLWSTGETTQQILVTQSGTYSVKTGNGTCQSVSSDDVLVEVIAAPTRPIVTVSGNTTICGSGSVELSGPVGFQYLWSNGATTQTITVTQTGVYYLIVKTTGTGCPSFPSDPVVVNVLTPPCGTSPGNQPPVVAATPLAAKIEGRVEADLTQLISDPDNNLDFSTLRVINNQTARGVAAYIDAAYFLQIDYSGIPFTGTDRITLEACDLAGACVQQVVEIHVVGEVVVFNGITPDGDGLNDFMEIRYIDVIEGALNNKVTIFNRWGDTVYEVEGYNNTTRVFGGQSSHGKELPSGTYFYIVEFQLGNPVSGFITLKR